MSEARKLSELTRQQLYDLVWSKPATKLAAEFGISDVALAKRCKKQDVPKPSLGYWAKLAAGGNPPQKPLPPPADEVFIRAAKQRVGKTLPLPLTTDALHPLATHLMQALPKARLDYYKRAYLQIPTLPEVNASKTLVARAARAFHVILRGVEHLGILYRKSQSSYSDGFFLRRHDRLYLRIEETIVEPDGSSRRRPSWDSQGHGCRPSGHLCFILKSDRYGTRDETEWTETAKLPLEKVLARLVTFIRKHFVETHHRRVQAAIEQQKRHIEWERRHKEWQEKEAIRLQQERERAHANSLTVTAETRTDDLLKAAEWWRLHRTVSEFITECQQRWHTQSGPPTVEQEAWLTWARQYASTLSPFQTAYPDPTHDGAFDAASVPFGGPYPPTRNFPPPPTLPKLRKLAGRSDSATADRED